VHFKIEAPGYEPLITHVFVDGDPYLDTDAVFGVKSSLIAPFPRHDAGTTAPDGRAMREPWYSMTYDMVLAPARG
jgi:hydroxyquinol 1,2-dioxygenase